MEKTIAILFVDIVDSTRLYEALGNEQAMLQTRKLLQALQAAVETNQGRVVKSLGDGLLCAFDSTDDACLAAGAMVETKESFDLEVRVGLHRGPVIETEQRDILGDAVNLAARVESLARPSEILATDDFVEALSKSLKLRARLVGSTTVKGKTTPTSIYGIRSTDPEPEDSFESTIVGISLQDAKLKESLLALHLIYRGQHLVVTKELGKVTIGRGESCGLRILSKQASRHHGTVDYVREAFIITDQSSNGTFLRIGNGPPVVLFRDSTKLVGSGLIGFGAAPDDESQDHVVKFRCDIG